jgi:hypothetical protein
MMLCRDELILLSSTDLRDLTSAPSTSSDLHDSLRRTHDWVVEFLCAPNAKLGRHGLVCPFTKPSLDNDLFFMATPTVEPGDTVALQALVGRYKEWFVELRGRTAEGQRHLVTLVLVLPDFVGPAVHELDEVQRRLKDEFVGEGLMIGQFYPECPVPGLWSSTFRPLASPVPLLAMREMVSSDLPFLVGCPAHAHAYLDRYGHGIPSHMRRYLVERLATSEAGAGSEVEEQVGA